MSIEKYALVVRCPILFISNIIKIKIRKSALLKTKQLYKTTHFTKPESQCSANILNHGGTRRHRDPDYDVIAEP